MTAIDFAKMNLCSRQSLLEVNGQALGEIDFEADCQKVLAKITASGSVGTRELCRKIHGAKAGWLKPILQDLIKSGKIVELSDGRVQSTEHRLTESALASA
jgi:hypothetical protein